MQITSNNLEAGAVESITVSSTAIGCTAGTIKPTTGDFAGQAACGAYMTVETANIRVWANGTDPTTTTGHLVYAGQSIVLENANEVSAFRAIRDDSTDATIQATYKF